MQHCLTSVDSLKRCDSRKFVGWLISSSPSFWRVCARGAKLLITRAFNMEHLFSGADPAFK